MGPLTLNKLKLSVLRDRLEKLFSGKGPNRPSLEDAEDQAPARFIPPIDSSDAAEVPHQNGASGRSWSRPLLAVKGVFTRGPRKAASSDSAEPKEELLPAAVNGHDSPELLEDLNLEQAIELLQNELNWSD